MIDIKNPVRVLGLMSGTSLDGLDIALCEFRQSNRWEYKIIEAKTYIYTEEWHDRLQHLYNTSAEVFAETDSAYGRLLGEYVLSFLEEFHLNNDGLVGGPILVASHGHTIFHNPAMRFTSQIGDGAAIASISGLPVVCDFRRGDVALGGQGAPLVPIGDELLFGEFDGCLNLGGIANVSFLRDGIRTGWDIAPVNMALNYISGFKGLEYDRNGDLARGGVIIDKLYGHLNELDFLKMAPPKTLGREWFNYNVKPLIDIYSSSPDDLLATQTCWIADVLSTELNSHFKEGQSILCTGGGAHNGYLISLLKDKTLAEVVVPDHLVVDYKEALIFAFLGLLRLNELPNNVPSCTGASRGVSGGAIYLP